MKTTRDPDSAAATILWGTAAALVLAVPAAVMAQSLQAPPAASAARPPGPGAKPDWSFRLGAGALYQPEYEGSDEYTVLPLPMLMVSYRDLVFLRGPMLGANAFTWQGAAGRLQVGPLLRYQLGRYDDDSDDLRGMGDIDGSVELGGFITYGLGPWSAGVAAFRDVSGSHEGLTAKLSAGNRLSLGPRLLLRSEISTTWADDNYTETFFGVTRTQSARSGLRQYRPDGGFKDAGITLDLDYSLSERWGITGRVAYKRMLGDAADSPLVKDRGSADQFSTGFFISYRF
ncbi:MltA-interacting MipA family protein [Allostella vacuolata]|nr:MltA-interacting MipA family protein [Stella vacuolata]